MTWLYGASAVLVGAGVSLVLALLWLKNAGQKRRHVLAQILALRSAFEADPLQGLSQAGDVLPRLGLPGLRWEGEWYGAPVHGAVGDAPEQAGSAARLSHTLSQTDVHLTLTVTLQGLRGEARLFAEQSAQLLFAIFEGALAARELALVSATAQRAELAVFLQHDIRNLTQWVELLADDFSSATDANDLMGAATRAQVSAVMARERAQRIAAAMLKPKDLAADSGDWHPLPLRTDIVNAAAMHGVAVEMVGLPDTLQPMWSVLAWATVLDNIFGNTSKLGREQRLPISCLVEVARTPLSICVSFSTPQLPLRVPLSRVFEPWASVGLGASGLGMYQARRVVMAEGATLKAFACGKGLTVTLCIPCKNSLLPVTPLPP